MGTPVHRLTPLASEQTETTQVLQRMERGVVRPEKTEGVVRLGLVGGPLWEGPWGGTPEGAWGCAEGG